MKAVVTLNSYLRTLTLAPNLTHIPNPTSISIEIFAFGIIQIFIMSIPNAKYIQLVVFWEILLLLPNAFYYISFNRYTSSVLKKFRRRNPGWLMWWPDMTSKRVHSYISIYKIEYLSCSLLSNLISICSQCF